MKTYLCKSLLLFSFSLLISAKNIYAFSAGKPLVPKRLLYAIETVNCGAVNQGYIQACMREMTFRDQQTLPVFEKITYMNGLTDLIDLEKRIYSYALFFNPNLDANKDLSSTRLLRDSLLSKILIGNNMFLLIKIRRDDAGNYIYNFTCTQQNLDKVTTAADLTDLKFSSYDALLRNPSEDQSKLRTALYNVFTDANRKPECTLLSNAVISQNQYWFASGDTLKLHTLINDDDSEFFSYTWLVKSNRKNVLLDTGKSRQSLHLQDTGQYIFIVCASDGITISPSDTVKIHVIFRPEIRDIKDNDKWILFPKKMYYQPHFVMREYKTVRLKNKRLFLREKPSQTISFTFEEEGNPASKTDTAFQNQFSTIRDKGYYSIWLRQRKKEPGTYNFAVTATDYGLQSQPFPLSFRFRKAAKVYFQAGVSVSHYSGGPEAKKVHQNQLGIGFFVYPLLHADYILQFPGLDNTDPQFGQNQTLKYPGHRFTISGVIPTPKAPEALITFDMLLTTFRYPELSAKREA
ncbi:MAG: hypothetical protein ACRC3B_08440, partial [Bacteroidia bacterium]